MSEETTQDPTLEEQFAEGSPMAGLQRLIDGINDKAEDRALELVTEKLAALGAGSPNRSRSPLGDGDGDERPANGKAARVAPGWERKYIQLPEWQREYRTPEGDEMVKRWLIAVRDKDVNMLRQVAAEDRILSRATLEVSPIDPATGIGSGTGGATVPVPMATFIMALLQRMARMRNIASVQTSANASLRWPIQNTLSTATWEAESAEINQGEPDFTEKVLVKKKLGTISRFSNEMLSDSAFDLVSFVGNDVARTFAAEEDRQFSTSDGTGNLPTKGVDKIDLAAAATPLGVAGTLTAQDLVNLYFAVDEPYRQEAVWAGNDAVLALLTSLRDGPSGTSGRQILDTRNAPLGAVSDMPPGTIGTIMNRPVVSLPLTANGAGGATDPNTNRLYFGAFNRFYGILDGGGIQAAVSTDRYFELDQVAYRWTRRMDGRDLLPITTQCYAFFDDLRSIG